MHVGTLRFVPRRRVSCTRCARVWSPPCTRRRGAENAESRIKGGRAGGAVNLSGVHLLQKENMSAATMIKKNDLKKAYFPDADGSIVCQGCVMSFQADSTETCLCGMNYNEVVQANEELWDKYGDAVTDASRLTDDELQDQYKVESKDNKYAEFVAMFRGLEAKVHNTNIKELSKETRRAIANDEMVKYVNGINGKSATELAKKGCSLKYVA